LEQHQPELKSVGLQVVAIAQGEPKHAQRYCGKIAPSIDCLIRDDTTVYKQYGLSRVGLKELTHSGNLSAGIRLMRNGVQFGQIIGDPAMMTGTFLIDTNGMIQFVHYNQHMGDHPSFETLIQTAIRMKARSDA
jgi:hypothetical protein